MSVVVRQASFGFNLLDVFYVFISSFGCVFGPVVSPVVSKLTKLTKLSKKCPVSQLILSEMSVLPIIDENRCFDCFVRNVSFVNYLLGLGRFLTEMSVLSIIILLKSLF